MSKRTLAARLRRFCRDRRGAFAIEFGLVAPMMIALSAAILEFILLFSDYQGANEATRRGVRAVLIADSLADLTGLDAPGSTPVTCSSTDTVLSGSTTVSCTTTKTTDADTIFQGVVGEMKAILPAIRPIDVRISYSQGGVDVDPDGPLKTPLVTVSLNNVQHNVLFISNFFGLPTSWTLPSFSASRLSHTRITGT